MTLKLSDGMNQSERSLAEREAEVLCKEQAVAKRLALVDERELLMGAREEAVRAGVAAHVGDEAQLREANEQLVLATVNALAMTELAEKTTADMAYMAEHDFLTGLPNRALLTDRLNQSMSLALRNHKRVALLYLDLDNFKHINDSLGHSLGDQVLQATAKRLQTCIRGSDTVSRQGGDEFVVLLPDLKTAADANVIAEKVLKVMAEPHLVEGQRLHVTVSIGISIYPDDGEDVGTVVKNADTAMYYAKKNGRNNYEMFTAEMNTRAVARQSVEQALHHGLEHNGFVLHYQPKVNLDTGVITGAEALVRLRQEDRELIGPQEFVGIAEECGLILSIGKWVLREACRQTAAWLKAGLELCHIAVNVSAVEFHGKDFIAGVRSVLHETGLPPHILELELTETGLIQDTKKTSHVLSDLKKLGVQIAIDDFGTGYSSLSYLRRFPIDTLKIDKSFVQDIDGNGGNAIVSAIVALGTSLGQRVIAEGIETPQQLEFLKSLGCPEGQGYFFSRPVAADVFAALLPRTARQQPRPMDKRSSVSDSM